LKNCKKEFDKKIEELEYQIQRRDNKISRLQELNLQRINSGKNCKSKQVHLQETLKEMKSSFKKVQIIRKFLKLMIQ